MVAWFFQRASHLPTLALQQCACTHALDTCIEPAVATEKCTILVHGYGSIDRIRGTRYRIPGVMHTVLSVQLSQMKYLLTMGTLETLHCRKGVRSKERHSDPELPRAVVCPASQALLLLACARVWKCGGVETWRCRNVEVYKWKVSSAALHKWHVRTHAYATRIPRYTS